MCKQNKKWISASKRLIILAFTFVIINMRKINIAGNNMFDY